MDTADQVAIPLLDGRHTLAQIARVEDGRMLVYVTRSQTTPDAATKPLIDRQVMAAFCLEADSLPGGHWTVVGYEAVPRIAPFRNDRLLHMDLTDPAIVEAFANAMHGLYPWDGFPDKDLFTKMLRVPDVLPTKARMTADFPTPDGA
ncbi:hypothetical protein N9V68_01535 [Octadecabacter sp.]|nr:hypothetical protein [Octadecabacter sp.]